MTHLPQWLDAEAHRIAGELSAAGCRRTATLPVSPDAAAAAPARSWLGRLFTGGTATAALPEQGWRLAHNLIYHEARSPLPRSGSQYSEETSYQELILTGAGELLMRNYTEKLFPPSPPYRSSDVVGPLTAAEVDFYDHALKEHTFGRTQRGLCRIEGHSRRPAQRIHHRKGTGIELLLANLRDSQLTA